MVAGAGLSVCADVWVVAGAGLSVKAGRFVSLSLSEALLYHQKYPKAFSPDSLCFSAAGRSILVRARDMVR